MLSSGHRAGVPRPVVCRPAAGHFGRELAHRSELRRRAISIPRSSTAFLSLRYYGTQRQLEYDILVAPGADPSVVMLALTLDGTAGSEPARAFRLDAAGDVVLATAGGTLRLHQPVVYQEIAEVRHAIACRYVLGPGAAGAAGGVAQLRVQVAAYDRGQPLIMDPVVRYATNATSLGYSTFLGGSDSDEGLGIAVDGTCAVYVTGATSSTNFPTTPGAVQPTLGGRYSSDAFVTKLVLDPPGSGRWSAGSLRRACSRGTPSP